MIFLKALGLTILIFLFVYMFSCVYVTTAIICGNILTKHVDKKGIKNRGCD